MISVLLRLNLRLQCIETILRIITKGDYMGDKIIFNSIINDSIFCDDFNGLTERNEFDFENKDIVVLYGANGVGKSCLANVLDCKEGSFSLKYKGKIYTQEDQNFFILLVIKLTGTS